jgi:hypothetical protein
MGKRINYDKGKRKKRTEEVTIRKEGAYEVD